MSFKVIVGGNTGRGQASAADLRLVESETEIIMQGTFATLAGRNERSLFAGVPNYIGYAFEDVVRALYDEDYNRGDNRGDNDTIYYWSVNGHESIIYFHPDYWTAGQVNDFLKALEARLTHPEHADWMEATCEAAMGW